MKNNYIILIHGLWDNPNVFNNLSRELKKQGFRVFIPHLPHKLGNVSISILAEMLNDYILKEIGLEKSIDLLGFSMGGLISRFWLKNMGGWKITRRFISVGSPHRGTLTAQFIPAWLLVGISEMKKGSTFLKDLNNDLNILEKVECISFYCILDLMVFPGWQAILPIGKAMRMPVLTHKGLINQGSAIKILVNEFLR